MDYILLSLCAFFGIKGYFKGFVSMLFAMIGIVAVAIFSWQLTKLALPYAQENFGNFFVGLIQGRIDKIIPGQFSNMADLVQAIGNSKLSLFGAFLLTFAGDITIDGNISAGQILAPSISNLIIKILVFVIIFLVLYVLLKILRFLIDKIIKKCGLSLGNRLLGTVFGLVKGLFLFGILYFVLSTIANLFMLEGLLSFVKNGVFSNFIYDNFILRIVAWFY